jgi:CCR4-NOT transcription complex subunit 1
VGCTSLILIFHFQDSKVFKVTNPMIAGILSLLAELHSLKGLKINNAFSIELVFKAFNIQAEDVKPTDVLRSLPRERQCNPDWGMEILGAEPENTTPLPGPGDGKGQQQNLQQGLASLALQQQLGRNLLPPGMEMQGKPEAPSLPVSTLSIDSLLSTIHPLVVVGAQLAQVADRLQLKVHIPVAIDRAIGEILNPVVERSVTIACYTAVELILKDFSTDPDESRMRKAAHLMVSTLAGSLAMVTSKDPLRVSFTNSLKAQLMVSTM